MLLLLLAFLDWYQCTFKSLPMPYSLEKHILSNSSLTKKFNKTHVLLTKRSQNLFLLDHLPFHLSVNFVCSGSGSRSWPCWMLHFYPERVRMGVVPTTSCQNEIINIMVESH